MSPNDASVGYTFGVYTVLIDPETEGHSRHQFQSSDCTTGDTRIEVGIPVLECHHDDGILDACLNLRDGAAATLRGLDHLDRIQVGADLGESDGGVDGHGLSVVDSGILEQGGGGCEGGGTLPQLSSDGARALGDPQGESHGGRLGDCLSGATLSECLFLQGGALGVRGTDQHVASDLEGLLFGHGRLWLT